MLHNPKFVGNVHNVFGVPLHFGFKAGVEFELESVKGSHQDILTDKGVSLKEDPSLRNSGCEFITKPFSEIDTLVEIHKTLLNSELVTYYDKKDSCSERCSTHVHVNVSDLKQENINNLIFLYYLLEPLFYDFVAPIRKHNIYCVPLNWTALPRLFGRQHLDTAVVKWSKYTGFNIKPISSLGTIEFRHLEATLDSSKFAEWMHILHRWYHTGLNVPVTLNSLEDVEPWVNAVFKVEDLPKTNLNSYLENQILDLKLAFLKPENRWK